MSAHSVAFSSNKSGSQAWFTVTKSYLKSSEVGFFFLPLNIAGHLDILSYARET